MHLLLCVIELRAFIKLAISFVLGLTCPYCEVSNILCLANPVHLNFTSQVSQEKTSFEDV